MARADGSWVPRAILLVVLPLLVGGCAVRLAYDNVDRLARWAVSDYVAMTEAQRSRFDAQVRELWDWHRRDHLPRYADFLEALPAALADGTDATEIEAIVNRVVDWALEIERASRPLAVDLLTSLSDAQVDALGRNLRESNERLARTEARQTLAQSQRTWQKDTASRFSRFSGRLTADQRAYLTRQSLRYQPDTVLWAAYRARWQADLLGLLAEREDRAAFAAAYAALSDRREAYQGEELTAVWASNRALAAEVSAWLIDSLTPRQRDRFDGALLALADDFRALAGGQADPDDELAEDLCGLVLQC